MFMLKITQTADGLAILLDEEAKQVLAVGAGSEISARLNDDGEIVLAPQDMSPEARRERGRAFIQRYQKTFDALAK
jgi:hypothetical protein